MSGWDSGGENESSKHDRLSSLRPVSSSDSIIVQSKESASTPSTSPPPPRQIPNNDDDSMKQGWDSGGEEYPMDTSASSSTWIDLVRELDATIEMELDPVQRELLEDRLDFSLRDMQKKNYYSSVSDYLRENHPNRRAALNILNQVQSVHTQSYDVLVVVDTNFLLSHLRWLAHFREVIHPYGIALLIPLVVLMELDKLKSDGRSEEICRLARMGNALLFEWLRRGVPGVIGQTIDEAIHDDDFKYPGCNDDEILYSCLQYRRQSNRVLLLSNDKK